jgi:CheY-like chemotaxis protein
MHAGPQPYYEFVLIDIQMPGGIDGIEVTARLSNYIREGKILPLLLIQCTASNDYEMYQKSIEAGAHAFITKPINYAVILEAIRLY